MERIKISIAILMMACVACSVLAQEATARSSKPVKVRTETATDNRLSTFYHVENASQNAHKKQFECGSKENRHIGDFTIYDYSIVIGMLVISLGIGVFYGFINSSAENSSSDFLHGTEMSLLPVTLSLTTSFITAIELLGNPSEITYNGTQFSLIGMYLQLR